MRKQYDLEEAYCKILGHFLTFDYCRKSNKSLPCSKILDCWFQQLPIQDFIRDNYSKEEREQIFTPQPPKILSLSDILKQAQERIEKSKD